MAFPAMPPTNTLLTEISVKPIPSVIPVTALLCSRLLRTAGFGPPVFWLPNPSWDSSPYNLGVAVRCERLDPKTAVPRTARSRPAPYREGRSPPERALHHSFAPGRCEHRSPRSVGGTRRRETTHHRRGTGSTRPIVGPPGMCRPHRWPYAKCQYHHHRRQRPSKSTSGSKATPVELSAARALAGGRSETMR